MGARSEAPGAGYDFYNCCSLESRDSESKQACNHYCPQMSFHKVVAVSGLTAAQILAVKDSMSAENTFLYLGLPTCLQRPGLPSARP